MNKKDWPAPPPEIAAEVYPKAIATAREVAKDHGYAIGVHGSQKRDLDLIAAPWVDGCSSPLLLAEAIARVLGWWLHPKSVLKPHGRIAFTIFYHDHLYIDLSVMASGGSNE